jgi:UDP-N-acetylglucosamine acyltransferase
MSAVHQFVQIGAHAFISGGALVRKDVPPFTKAAREPLSYVGINSIGLRRRGYSNERINAIQDIYRIMYLKGYNISQGVSIIEAESPATPERDEILAFISRSTRGLMKGYGKIDRRNA